MIFLVLVLLFVCVAFPLGYAWRVWRLEEPTITGWLLVTADAAVFVALVILVGRGDIAGYYTRFVLLAVFVVAVLWSLGRHVSRPWRSPESGSTLKRHWTTAVSLVFFAGALVYVVSGMVPPDSPRQLAFPLEGGRFMVAHGGGNTLLNRHSSHAQQRYAADISAIGPAGFRALGVLPRELERYAIYGASVVSPCDGEVTVARDGLPDLVPSEMDPDNPAGNHVIIDCGDISVELAHLQQSSVAVAVGDQLAVGDPVGRVGNSGNTTEPHLHVHAVDPTTRTGVPVSFDGRVPIRNRLYVR